MIGFRGVRVQGLVFKIQGLGFRATVGNYPRKVVGVRVTQERLWHIK